MTSKIIAPTKHLPCTTYGSKYNTYTYEIGVFYLGAT